MRLEELFETFIKEDPEVVTEGRTVTMSLADLYKMTNTPFPVKEGPNGNPVVPNGFYDDKTFKVGGEDGISKQLANAHQEYLDGGGIKGQIKKDGEIRPYNDNHFLIDMGWKLAAGTVELASTWSKGGAYVVDDVLNKFTSTGIMYNVATGKDLSNLGGSAANILDNLPSVAVDICLLYTSPSPRD